MTLSIVSFLLLALFPLRTCNAADDQRPQPPNPGFSPVGKFDIISFEDRFKNLWGPSHQNVDKDGVLNLLLDKSSGSGFVSKNAYNTLYLGADIKLPNPNDTAGLDISLYLSSSDDCSGNHDEIDIEFLGSIDEDRYHLQTNVIITDHSIKYDDNGNKINNIGREEVFKLWFDPTEDYHNYALVKSNRTITFFVDSFPIRRFPNRKKKGFFPKLTTKVYGSIWDASDWATENGLYKVDYGFAPFVAKYKNFQISECNGIGCSVTERATLGLSTQQKNAMKWIQSKYRIYDYCNKISDTSLEEECKQKYDH